MRNLFTIEELQDIQLAEPFAFTKGCRLMKISGSPWQFNHPYETMLFDLDNDHGQNNPIQDPVIEARMITQMRQMMKENDAPPEQFDRLGI